MANAGRIRKEFEDLKKDTSSGIKLVRDESNPMHMTGTIKGPDDTPYAGGVFAIDINIPSGMHNRIILKHVALLRML